MIQRRRKRQIIKLALKDQLTDERKKEIDLMVESGEEATSLSIKESQYYLKQVIKELY